LGIGFLLPVNFTEGAICLSNLLVEIHLQPGNLLLSLSCFCPVTPGGKFQREQQHSMVLFVDVYKVWYLANQKSKMWNCLCTPELFSTFVLQFHRVPYPPQLTSIYTRSHAKLAGGDYCLMLMTVC
jgi:hypothetical protein